MNIYACGGNNKLWEGDIMKAIIMAGGEGKRLKPVTGDMPKPLVPLCGRPVMEHIILLLKRHGITDICAALKYRPDDIKPYRAGMGRGQQPFNR